MRDESKSPNFLIGGRLRQFRLSLGMTIREFAEAASMHHASVAVVESGRNLFQMDSLRLMVERLGLNANWLLTGDGPMKVPPEIIGRPQGKGENLGAFVMEEISGSYWGERSRAQVPIMPTPLSAGPVPDAGDLSALIPPGLVRHPRFTYAFFQTGVAMSPIIRDGWFVLVDCHNEAIAPTADLSGRPVIMEFGTGRYILWSKKGKRGWTLYPENPDAGLPEIRVGESDTLPIIGRVTWWSPVK